MKKIPLLLPTVLLLSSCATVGTLREGKPILNGSSSKSPNDFASCVANSWSGMVTSVNSLPIENGIALTVPHPVAGNDAVLDVVASQTGSTFKLYERLPSLTPHKFDDVILGYK